MKNTIIKACCFSCVMVQIIFYSCNQKSNNHRFKDVYDHYKGNTLMHSASTYLLNNMNDHFSVDKKWDEELFEVYEKHVKISEKHNWSVGKEWGVEIDSLKDQYRSLYKTANTFNISFDVDSIKTDWLI